VQKWKECCGELHQIFRLSLVALLLLVTFQVKYLLLRSNPAVHIFTRLRMLLVTDTHSSSMLAVLCLAQFFDPVSFGSLLASAHVLARSSK
jgi:hypothetical protein